MKTNLLLPIAGKAQRFIDQGFAAPKPLIMVKDRHMIDWALESVDTTNVQLIFAVRKDHVRNYSIDAILKSKFGDDIKIVIADAITGGALETCLLAEPHIDNDMPLVIYTPDVTFGPKWSPTDWLNSTETDGLILTFKANNPAHSYAELDTEGYVTRTAEKEVISEEAAVGVYCFRRGSDFVRYAKETMARDLRTNGEYYICPIYNLMIRDKMKVTTCRTEKMHVLGTPEDLEFFTNNVLPRFGDKPIGLCSDHSGYDMKEMVKKTFREQGITFIDFGTYTKSDCDHYDFIADVVRHINDGTCDFGMGFCRTGQGFNIAANKHVGIRSALIFNTETAEMSKRHNCANFFCLPEAYLIDQEVRGIIKALVCHTFDGGRHMTRIQKIEANTGV